MLKNKDTIWRLTILGNVHYILYEGSFCVEESREEGGCLKNACIYYQGPLFNLSIKEYLKWECPLLLLRNYNKNKNLKFNPKSSLTKIHILPFYSAATFSASLQSARN